MSATVRTSSRIQARKSRTVSTDAEPVAGGRKRKNSKDDQASDPSVPQTTPVKKSAIVQNVTSPNTTRSSAGQPTTPTAAAPSKHTNVVPLSSPVVASPSGTIATRSSQRVASLPKGDASATKPTSSAKPVPVATASVNNAPATASSAQAKSGPMILGDVESAAQPVAPVLPPTHIFKNPNFTHSGRGGAATGKKTRTWKTLKQIIASERAQLNRPVGSTYSSIDAPPSRKPAKKYSDISGLPAKYTDPRTKLRYSTTEEFAQLRMLPQDIVNGLLALRRANLDVQ